MRSYACIILGCVCMITSLLGQVVPGYQGKKTVVSYRADVSMAFRRPSYFNRVEASHHDDYPSAKISRFVPLNISHTLGVERVLGRKFSMSLNYTYVATKDYVFFSQSVQDPLQGNNTVTYTFRDVQMNVYGHYITGSFVFYMKRALAPFGKYIKLNLSYCKTYGSFTQASFTTEPQSVVMPSTIYTFDAKGVHYGLNTFGAGISLGTNRIYKDCIVVNRGINLFYMFTPYYETSDLNNIYPVLIQRLRGHDLVSLYVSVGYLF